MVNYYKPQRRKKNPWARLVILVIILIIICFATFKLFFGGLKAPVDSHAGVVPFVVQKGESVDSISKRLEKANIIKSALVFKWEVKTNSKYQNIQAGDYKISASMSLDEILTTMSAGAVDKWVTLLEGWRVEEMAAKLNNDLGIDKGEFLKYAKEGYMFPDTYLFNRDATAQTVAATLNNTFKQRYSEQLQAQIKAQDLTPDQGLILASIVEREARSDKVRTEVAGILLKRLKIGMGLNVDATIQYALGYQADENSWWKRNLSKQDLKIDSVYNTYLHAGLPPTPICNPSLSSLKAVANADSSTPYLYYYHDSQGNTYYASTLEEHNANIANHK